MFDLFGDLLNISKTATTKNYAFIVTESGYGANDIKRLLKQYKINSWDYQYEDRGIWFRVQQDQFSLTKEILQNHDISFI